jgi:hypothetical protein
MTETTTDQLDRASDGWAEMLLALAGRIGDARLVAARNGQDDDSRLRQVLAGLDEAGAALTEADLLALLLVAEPGDPSATARQLAARGGPILPDFRFSPLDPRTTRQEWTSLGDEFEARTPWTSSAEPLEVVGDRASWVDEVAIALVDEAAEHAGVRGIWGVVRRRASRAAVGERVERDDAAAETRVFLVETSRPYDVSLAQRLHERLTAVGEEHPQVETFTIGASLPEYHRSALASAALLWAVRADEEPEVVPVFDRIDPQTGPSFADDHPKLPDDERSSVAAYLSGAEPVLLTTAKATDVLDQERRALVPLSYRTDGTFVWSDAVAYYAEHHGLAPYAPLLDAIRSAGYRAPEVDGVTLFRAENTLMRSPA